MRNYVIINGVNSLTIQGLAINILPSITKAPIRTINETIDGRDGDITTFLGYGAYDKTIEIGLFGNFNVDKVIQYFNTKGTIVFSDENDKVYNFEINDQIDFAKLIKFRTATINIHCQPFKYPLSETPIEQSVEYVNASGTDLTLNNTDEMPFAQFDLKGNTSQSGTPTPTNPIDVDVVSGENTIEIVGKNLLNVEQVEVGKAWNNTTASNRAVVYMEAKPNTNYTISYQTKNGNDALYYFEKANKTDATTIVGTTAIPFTLSITTNANTNWIGIQINRATITKENVVGTELQVEKGSTATAYELYQSQSYSIDLGDIELCKIGTAQDYIHKINGGWVIHREIFKYQYTGDEQINAISNHRFQTKLPQTAGDGYYTTIHFCNCLKPIRQEISSSTADTNVIVANGTWSYIILDSTTTLETYKQFLQSNDVIVYYKLLTPIEEAIEDADLIAQLDALERATSYDTQTNIIQTNNDLPFMLNVDAIKKGSNSATITNDGNIYSKPIIDLIGTGNVGIYLNGVQMFEIDLSEENEIVINTEEMEAYNPSTLALANRKVIGDYSQFKLDAGANTLSFSGKLTKATISKYTRWL